MTVNPGDGRSAGLRGDLLSQRAAHEEDTAQGPAHRLLQRRRQPVRVDVGLAGHPQAGLQRRYPRLRYVYACRTTRVRFFSVHQNFSYIPSHARVPSSASVCSRFNCVSPIYHKAEGGDERVNNCSTRVMTCLPANDPHWSALSSTAFDCFFRVSSTCDVRQISSFRRDRVPD